MKWRQTPGTNFDIDRIDHEDNAMYSEIPNRYNEN